MWQLQSAAELNKKLKKLDKEALEAGDGGVGLDKDGRETVGAGERERFLMSVQALGYMPNVAACEDFGL